MFLCLKRINFEMYFRILMVHHKLERLTFRALALRQSLWRRANVRNVSFVSLYGGQFTLSSQLMILNYPILSHRRRNAISLETYPLYSECFLVVFCSSASFFDEMHSQNPTNFYQALQLMLFCYSKLEVISSKITRVWNFFLWTVTLDRESNV